MMLTGRTYGAEDGLRFALSHYVVGPGEGLAKGLELAKRVAQNAASPISPSSRRCRESPKPSRQQGCYSKR